LERTLQFVKGETPADKLHKLETAFAQAGLVLQEAVPLVAALLSLPLPEERYAPLTLAPQRQRQQTIETLLTILAAYASRQPILLIIEDLQWIDASTLELLDLLITQGPPARLLAILTYRPDFDPLWRDQAHVTHLLLQRLVPQHIEHMARQIAGGKTLPAELLQHLISKTDGIPLFIEEVTKMAIESGLVREQAAHYVLMGSLPTLTIPTTLQGSLLARLDQSAAGKAVAQLGATIGRSFTHALLRDVSPFDATTLQQGLQYLVETEMLYQRGDASHPTYVFKHALVQDVAYQSLLRSTRQHYHERIARVLEAHFPDLAATQPELLAHHLTEAGLSAAALPYWQRAARHTIQRSAHVETIGHLTQGLALVSTLPDTPERTQHELTLYLTLGNTLVKLKGYGTPEVGQAYDRARTLSQQIRDPRQMARVLYGLWVFYLTRAEFQTAQELATQLLDLARLHHDTDSLLRGHNAQGTTLCFLGEFAQAHAHLAQGMACKALQTLHTDATIPQVANFAYASWALWYMGYPERALASSQAAQALAQERHHPFSRAIALFYAAILHQLRREPEAAREQADATIALATELEFPVWVAGGTLVRGWALVAQGQQAEGLAQIQEGLAAWRTTGGELIRPSGLAKLAEAYALGGQPALGLSVLAEALATVNHTGMRYYEAELYRLQGELVLQSGLGPSGVQTPDAEAEASFHKALAVARQQGAKSLELRTAVSLCGLWQRQGKRQAAAQLLAPVYHWFSEGFDTAALQEAQALLQTLV
jgi:predicted ATPase